MEIYSLALRTPKGVKDNLEMKCKDCKHKKRWECVHPAHNVSGISIPVWGYCDLALVNDDGARRGFERKE